MKVMNQRMSHPPLKFFHLTAIGSSHAKILSLNTRKSIPTTIAPKAATTAKLLCTRVSFLKVL